MNQRLLKLIERSDAIPSMPQIVTRLLEITKDENFAQSEVVGLLSTDPGVTGDILKLANSPLFGVTRQISSLMHACNLLGIKRIRTLVLGRCMVDKINKNAGSAIDISYYWRRSLATGVLAARFADKRAPKLREEAFIGGLLSDVGVIVMAQAAPAQYKAIASDYRPHGPSDWVQREREAMGVSHADVSAMILEKWAVPEVMVDAVRCHHDPKAVAEQGADASALARVICGASELAKIICESPESADIKNACEHALNVVDLDVSVFKHVLKEIESDISELAKVLKIDVIPSKVYALIADAINEKLEAVGT
jgi:HD-like signal output (HDOD) protein